MLGSNKFRVRYITPNGDVWRIYRDHYHVVSSRARHIARKRGWLVGLVEEVE